MFTFYTERSLGAPTTSTRLASLGCHSKTDWQTDWQQQERQGYTLNCFYALHSYVGTTFSMMTSASHNSIQPSREINRFTTVMSFHNNQWKCETWNPEAFLSSFSHWHVKGFSSKRIALKVDVLNCRTGKYTICKRGNLIGWGSEGVNGDK